MKNIVSIQALYNLYKDDVEYEFGLGVLLRSLLMDAILGQYLRFFTLQTQYSFSEIKEKLLNHSVNLLADGTQHILQDLFDFDKEITSKRRREIFDAVTNMCPNLFYEKNDMLFIKNNIKFK